MKTIELNRIRTLKPLEAIQKPLREFIAFDRSMMVKVYDEEFGWGEDDYEADLEEAAYLLEQVERRMKSLSHHLIKGKNARQLSVTPATEESVAKAS